MSQVRSGNAQAFDTLVPTIRNSMLTIAERLLIDRAAAEDCVQEALIRIWERRDTYRPGGHAWSWIARILRNECYAHWRRNRTAEFEPRSAIDLEYIPDGRTAVEVRILAGIEIAEIAQAIHRLRPIHREVLQLSCFNGLSDDEIASMLGISVGTVKSRKSRARSAIRDITKSGGDT